MKQYVNPEMIAQARQMDLLTYLRLYEPEEIVKISDGVYTTRTHDSAHGCGGRRDTADIPLWII